HPQSRPASPPGRLGVAEAIPSAEVPTVRPPATTPPAGAVWVSAGPAELTITTPPCPPDLFFSEYVEGSGNNKALEIFNGTPVTVDLSRYVVEVFANGVSTTVPAVTINLQGAVASGDVFVLTNASASAALLALADQTGSLGFNGNDAVVLRKGPTILDVIGQLGFDPGTQWGTDPISTADNTIRRRSSVSAGDPFGLNDFTPNLDATTGEW